MLRHMRELWPSERTRGSGLAGLSRAPEGRCAGADDGRGIDESVLGCERMKSLVMAGAFSVLVLSCGSTGGGGAVGAGASPFDGTWTGTWLDGDVQGDITFTLSGGGTVTGSVVLTGSPCIGNGAVTGTASGDSLNGEISAGGTTVSFSATATGTQMSGTFDAVTAGSCTGDTGTFTVSQ